MCHPRIDYFNSLRIFTSAMQYDQFGVGDSGSGTHAAGALAAFAWLFIPQGTPTSRSRMRERLNAAAA